MTVQYQGVWTLQNAAQLQSTQRWVTDPLFENTTLLLQADDAANGAQNNTFLDSSSNSFAITRNGNTTQGTFTPFSQAPGWWSNYFDGTGDYLLTALTGRSLGTGSFTVQCYFNISAFTSGYIVISSTRTGGGSDGTSLTVNSATQKITITTSGTVLYTGRTVIRTNQWYHLAYVRNGSSACSVYIDGVLDGTFTDARNFSGTQLLIGGGEGGNAELNGYISNYSITNTAVYTAAFTPPSTPTTSAVVILTCQSNRFVDNSGNNFTFTIGGTPSVQAFSPFAPQYQWTPSVIGGSGYFDGNGDYLLTGTTAIALGTGNFTMECWVRPNSSGGYIVFDCRSGVNSNKPTLGVVSSQLAYQTSGVNRILAGTVPINAWSHLAIVRNSNVIYAYINGVQVGTYSDSSDYGTVTRYGIGADDDGSPNAFFPGYISGARFVTTAVYTGTFTPPIAPLSTSGAASAAAYPSTTNVNTSFAASNTSLLLNFTNAGIYDGTMKNVLETVGNAQVSTAVVKYGSGSMAFDGSGDWLLFPASPNMAMGSGDFTWEAWIYFASGSTFRQIFSTRASDATASATAGSLSVNTTNGLTWFTSSAIISYAPNIGTNQWVHVAVCRAATTLRVFVNGIAVGSATNSDNLTANIFSVGANNNGSEPFNGYLDDVRITAGIARYTQNFIPPSVALPRQ